MVEGRFGGKRSCKQLFSLQILLSVHHVRWYSSVFSLLQKPANVGVESRIVDDSDFQTKEPEVAKLRDPYHTS